MTVNFIPPRATAACPADLKFDAIAAADILLGRTAAGDFSEDGVRIVGLRDKGYGARSEWLQNWLPDAAAFTYDEEDSSILSQAKDRFAVLVLHGTDIGRMTRIIQEWRRILPSKLIVAVVPAMDSRNQNDLLIAGADAVLDVTTPIEVAIAWLQSLILRTSERRAATATPIESTDEISARIHATPLQRKIVEILFANAGNIIGYDEILNGLNTTAGFGDVRSLHVAICNLRKKLPTGCNIFNIRGKGYKAIVEEVRR